MTDSPLLHHDAVVDSSDSPDGAGPSRPDPERWLVVLHGIYGAGRNWNSVARRLVRERPEWGARMVDLRGHGGSTGFEPPHTVEAAARDVVRTAREEGFEAAAVMGHSFGGKVALEHLRLAAAGEAPVPRQVWVIDSTPEAREPGGSAWEMLERLRRHPGPFRSRDEGIGMLTDDGLALPVARWMGTNLAEEGDGAWRWRIDFEVMESLLRDFFERDVWEVVEAPPEGTELHVVRAKDSSVLSGASLDRMRDAADASERLRLHEVEGGHWLNADNPDALVELLVEALPDER